jgi:purine catabolism regulator
MRFYLEDLMTLDSFHGSEVIAGKNGLENKISAANILDASCNFKYIKEESFVYYTADAFLQNDEGFISLLEQLSEFKVGALGIKLEQIEGGLSSVILAKADKLAIPIISLTDNFYYSDLVDKIRSHIYCHNTHEFIDQNDIHVIFNNAANSKGLYGTVELLNRLAGFDVIIVYGHEKLICPNKMSITEFDYDSAWEDSEIVITKNAIDTFDQEIHRCQVENQGDNMECIVTKLKYEDKVGYIWMFNKGRSFDESDYSLLRITTYWFDLIGEKLYEMQADKQKIRADIIKLLLSGEPDLFEEAIRKTQELNFNLPEKASFFVVKHTITKPKEIIDKINNFFFAEYDQLAVAGIYGSDVVVLVAQTFGDTKHLAKELHRFLMMKYPNHEFFLGVGRERSFVEFTESYDEAKHATKIGHANGFPVTDFEGLNLYRLVSYPQQSKEMLKFYNDYYLPLQVYDETHESELIKTMTIFLNSGCSYSTTAEMLHFHRNTIRYRIQVIEKLCKVNIRSLEGIINLGTALMVAPLIKGGQLVYENL